MTLENKSQQELIDSIGELESQIRVLQNRNHLINNQIEILWELNEVAFWQYDIQTHFLHLSPHLFSILDLDFDEKGIFLPTFLTFISENEIQKVKDFFDTKMYSLSGDYELEFSIKSKSGNFILWKLKVQPFGKNCFGKNYFCGSITYKKENTEKFTKIFEDQTHFNNIFKNSTNGIRIVNENGIITAINQKFTEITGFPEQDLLGKYIWDYLFQTASLSSKTSEYYQKIKSEIQTILNTGKILYENSIQEKKINTIDGSIRFVEAHYFAVPSEKGFLFYTILNDITEKKWVQEELLREKQKTQDQEERFKAISNQTSEGIALSDLEGRYLYVNQAFCTMTGYSEDELLQMTVFQLKAPNQSEGIFDMSKIQMRGKPMPVLLQRKDKTIFHSELIGNLITIGKKEFVLGSLRDITTRIAKDELIRKLSSAVEVAGVSIQITDLQGNLEYANPFFTKITGFKKEDFLGKKTSILNSKMHTQEFYQTLWQTIKSGNTWEGIMQNKKKSGELFWEKAIISPIFDFYGEIKHFVAVKADISEHILMENELKLAKEKAQQNERKLRTMFETSLSGLLFIKPSGFVSEANPVALEILGSPSLDVSSKINLFTFSPLKNIGFSQNLQNCINQNQIISEETVYTSIWNKTSYVKYFLVPITNKTGEIHGVWANIHDLTDFWSIQQDLIRAKEKAEESDKLKSAFLNNISHEIRTPLNAIIGFSQIISRLIPNDPKLLKYTETIHKNGNKLIEIITDVIEISEIQSKQSIVKMSVFNLIKTIENIVTIKQSIAQDKKLSFVTHIIPNIENISIVSDENKLSKILKHLVENAIKFTNTGSIVLEIIVQNKMLEINIFDTGIGISKEIQEVILQPFRQAELGLNRSFGGSGIGLSLVKGYTELLKGNFYLESEPMKGTNIYVKIPIFWHEENTEERSLIKTKILIVEDDYNSTKLLQNLLENKIDTLLFATNGQEAIEVCRENKDIHLILMDLRLPVIDGYAASSIIKAFMPHIPIIALTAFDIETEKEKILKHQFDGYIFKPIQPEELYALIKKVL